MDTQSVTALMAINLLAAYDTMNHQIMLNVLEKFYGIKGEAWQWLKAI